jgi:polyhydroxybutyrate depolymerase
VPTPTAPTSIVLSIDIGGRHRSSIVHLPSLSPGTVAPLLMALHGAGSDAVRFEAKTGFDQIADRDHFIVVYPEATLIGSAGTARTWNAGRCCSPASTTGVDDEEFLVALLDRLEPVSIDARRVYAVGHSSGNALPQRLGCDQAALFAAVASVAGSSRCHRVPALPVDGRDPWHSGSSGPNKPPVRGASMCGVADQCQPAAEVATVGPVGTKTWHCEQGSDVMIVQITGAQHPWPGGRTPPPAGQVASTALDASEVAWTFVSSYART